MNTENTTTSAWRRFWEKGGWWRALLLVGVYFAIYQLAPLMWVWALPHVDESDVAGNVWFYTVIPIAFGGLLLMAFAWSLGWLKELFGPQPIRGRGWMWIAVAVVLLFNILRFASLDYAEAGGAVLAWLVGGLVIGIAEETLTRGFVVNLMRKAGYREIAVASASALLFAAMHAGNLLGGQSLFQTGLQLVYTFAFGILMYLSLRVTGSLIWPILLHASTDPSIFLMPFAPASSLASIANLGNIAVTITGIILLFFIRGNVSKKDDELISTEALA